MTPELQQLIDTYCSAVYGKDVERFLASYADDVQVFDMWEIWSYDGKDEWRRVATEWFRSLGDEQVKATFDHMVTHVAGEMASLTATVTYAGLSADGKELRAMKNRLSWVVRKLDGGWKVVHEHTSAPASFETQQVKLGQ